MSSFKGRGKREKRGNLTKPINNLQKIAAFSIHGKGGNPAGVVIEDQLPPAKEMQEIAAEVGFSETVFACPQGDAWKVRYFSPQTEVPFCGHATIALGAALAMKAGNGKFQLNLKETSITVEGEKQGEGFSAALQSPPTKSVIAEERLVLSALELFGYARDDLDPRLEPALIDAGASHLMLALSSRKALSDMSYDLEAGRAFMLNNALVTIMLVFCETEQLFHVRNPFASGGVYEDPATGAAAAAFAGHLRKISWPHGGNIRIIQGEDMGEKSQIFAQFTHVPGSSIRVSGFARIM